MNSILKGCKQLQPVSHCNSPAIGNGRPRFFLSLLSPHSLHLPNAKNSRDERTRVGYEGPRVQVFSLYKFRLQTPPTDYAAQPTRRQVQRKYRAEEEEERNGREKERMRGRRMKKGETRIGNEGRDKGSTVMVVR